MHGFRNPAPFIAFSGILPWFPAMEGVMDDFSIIANFMAFALGFAAVTSAGLVIRERLSSGMVILRIITPEESEGQTTTFPAAENFGITRLDAKGSQDCVRMIMPLVSRTDIPQITDFIHTVNHPAFLWPGRCGT